MTKPEPTVPDPETPDPDPAGDASPGLPAAGTPGSGALPPHGPQPHDSQHHDSQHQESQPHDTHHQESAETSAADALSADDDAVWLDLVARLEEVGTAGDEPPRGGPAAGPEGPDSAHGSDSAHGAPSAWTFSDFDPLGLAGTAPIELSAEERLSPAAGKPAGGGHEVPDTAPGPRDYEPDDDDGAFVPEEPPSLAGADPMTVLAWIGAVGGPILLVLSAMFWRSAPLLAILGMVAAFAASVVFLIMKLPGEKDENDDGARV